MRSLRWPSPLAGEREPPSTRAAWRIARDVPSPQGDERHFARGRVFSAAPRSATLGFGVCVGWCGVCVGWGGRWWWWFGGVWGCGGWGGGWGGAEFGFVAFCGEFVGWGGVFGGSSGVRQVGWGLCGGVGGGMFVSLFSLWRCGGGDLPSDLVVLGFRVRWCRAVWWCVSPLRVCCCGSWVGCLT